MILNWLSVYAVSHLARRAAGQDREWTACAMARTYAPPLALSQLIEPHLLLWLQAIPLRWVINFQLDGETRRTIWTAVKE